MDRAVPGSSLQLEAELLKGLAGIDIVHIPYHRGDAGMTTALISGDIQLAFLPQSTALPNIQGNLIRGLGVTGTKRMSALPDVATAKEQGVDGLEDGSWNGLFAPAGTPSKSSTLQQAVAKALQDPMVRERILYVQSARSRSATRRPNSPRNTRPTSCALRRSSSRRKSRRWISGDGSDLLRWWRRLLLPPPPTVRIADLHSLLTARVFRFRQAVILSRSGTNSLHSRMTIGGARLFGLGTHLLSRTGVAASKSSDEAASRGREKYASTFRSPLGFSSLFEA